MHVAIDSSYQYSILFCNYYSLICCYIRGVNSVVSSASSPSSCSAEVRRVTGGARCECVNEGSAPGTGSGFNLAGNMEPRVSTMIPAGIRPGCCGCQLPRRCCGCQQRCCWRCCWWNSRFVLLISASLASLTWSISLCLSSSSLASSPHPSVSGLVMTVCACVDFPRKTWEFGYHRLLAVYLHSYTIG